MKHKMKWASNSRNRLRTALGAVAFIAVSGLLNAVAAAAAAQHLDAMEDSPILSDPPRIFIPAPDGATGPPLPFPGLSPEEADAARADLAERDRQAAAAAVAADRAWAALGDPNAPPIPPDLPPGNFVPYEVAPRSEVEIPRLAPPADTTANGVSSGVQTAASACNGDSCYQSDKLILSDPTVGLYASEYWVWLENAQQNESNQCDSTTETSICFWFFAIQHHMDSDSYSKSALHIGPQRGSSIAGETGSQWRMNIDGYIDGVHIGGQSTVDLPTATWIRVRTWRLNYEYSPPPAYKPWSTWGVWALYGGRDRKLGTVTIDGHLFKDSMLFSEVYEANGPCETDLVGGSFIQPRYWNTSVTQGVYSSARAEYQENCEDTTWELDYDDLVNDWRGAEKRIIDDKAIVWQF